MVGGLRLGTRSTHTTVDEAVRPHFELQTRTGRRHRGLSRRSGSSMTKSSTRREQVISHPTAQPTAQPPKLQRPPVPQPYCPRYRNRAASHLALHSLLHRRVPYQFVRLRHLYSPTVHSPAAPPDGQGAEVAEDLVGHTTLPHQARFRRCSTQQRSKCIAARPSGMQPIPDRRVTCITRSSRSASRSLRRQWGSS